MKTKLTKNRLANLKGLLPFLKSWDPDEFWTFRNPVTFEVSKEELPKEVRMQYGTCPNGESLYACGTTCAYVWDDDEKLSTHRPYYTNSFSYQPNPPMKLELSDYVGRKVLLKNIFRSELLERGIRVPLEIKYVLFLP